MSIMSVNGTRMGRMGRKRFFVCCCGVSGRRAYSELLLCVSLTRMMLMAFGPTSSVVDRRWPPLRPASGMVGSDDARGRLGRCSCCVESVTMNG
jgi:hypothetical protein